jgi:hypothetical protein
MGVRARGGAGASARGGDGKLRMGKSKKSGSRGAYRLSISAETTAWLRGAGAHVSGAALCLLALAAGVFLMKRYVERELAFPKQPPAVVLKQRPVWMSEFLAGSIAEAVRPAGAHSSFDHQMLVDRVAMLKANPWIRNVREVRRTYGQRPGDSLEIDCDYRAPIALVRWGRDYWLVDGEGVKLPERFGAADVPKIVVGRDGRTNIRIVEGVQRPPPQPGKTWGGEDLASGLEMVKRLYGLPFADEIVKVNVANFGGRVDLREAQLVLGTKHGTEIRWGRPIGARDDFIEVKPQRKFEYIRRVYEEFGRCDARQQWIDVRYDMIRIPSLDTTANASAKQSASRADGR